MAFILRSKRWTVHFTFFSTAKNFLFLPTWSATSQIFRDSKVWRFCRSVEMSSSICRVSKQLAKVWNNFGSAIIRWKNSFYIKNIYNSWSNWTVEQLKSFRYEKSKINLDLKRCLLTENRKYFQIDRLKPIRSLSKLKVLYIAHNYIREWREFDHLGELPCLEDLVFIGNPLEEDATAKVSQ